MKAYNKKQTQLIDRINETSELVDEEKNWIEIVSTFCNCNNYDEDFVKLNFGNVGGLITNIYLSMDVDFGNYSGAILGSATDESEYAYSGNQSEDF